MQKSHFQVSVALTYTLVSLAKPHMYRKIHGESSKAYRIKLTPLI